MASEAPEAFKTFQNISNIQLRDARWVIVDLIGKGRRERHTGAGAAIAESRCFMAPNRKSVRDRHRDSYAPECTKDDGVASPYTRDGKATKIRGIA